jgi:hypothetical protein
MGSGSQKYQVRISRVTHPGLPDQVRVAGLDRSVSGQVSTDHE